MNNPLLSDWNRYMLLPPFKKIKNIHFEEAIEIAMAMQNSKIEEICSQSTKPTFSNTIIPLINSGKKLTEILSILFSLCAADTNDEREKIRSKIAPKTASHFSKISQNLVIFYRISIIWKNRFMHNLSNDELRVIFLLKRKFLRSGVNLNIKKKKRFQEIIEELAILGTQFSQNVLKDEKSWLLNLSQEEIVNLPKFLISDMKRLALEKNKDGYCLNLTNSLVIPFLKFSPNRALRKTVLQSWKSRGLSKKKSNNSTIMKRTLKLRTELAKLLGFETYSDYRMETEIVKDPREIKNFLMKIWKATVKKVFSEAEDLKKLLNEDGIRGKLKPWDWRYYAEKMHCSKYNYSEEDFKQFFQLDLLIDAIFYTVKRLFGLEYEKISIDCYHPDCKIFKILRDGKHLGLFIGDYFSREGKRSGAWCSSLRSQSKMNGERISPIVVNVCNFTKPQLGCPCLLSYDEAKTLFHEFGHALHHLLSNVEFEMISGTSVSRDFVELPSQWFEHWLDNKEILSKFAIKANDGRSMPKDLMEKLISGKSFNSGFDTMEYLASALVDIEIHSEEKCDNPIKKQTEFLKEIGLHHAILPRHNVEHFAHIFSGDGYASAYYSYIWSEMMDEDAFLAFEETGDIFNTELAKKFENDILAKGGSDDPENLYRAFRGRLPSIEALIKSRNLGAFI